MFEILPCTAISYIFLTGFLGFDLLYECYILSPQKQKPRLKYGSTKMVCYSLSAVHMVWIYSLSRSFRSFLSSNPPNSFPFFWLFLPMGYLYPLYQPILPALDFSACFSSCVDAAPPLNTCVFHLCSLLMPLYSSSACFFKQREACQRLLFFHVSAIVLQFCRIWRLAGMRLTTGVYLPVGCRFCCLLPVLLLSS